MRQRQAGAGLSPRALFVRAADPEALLTGERLVEEIGEELARHVPPGGDSAESPSLDDLARDAEKWATEEADRHLGLLTASETPEERVALVHRAVLSCAPLSLLSGAWLQWLSGPGNAEEPVTLRVLSLYASDVGVSHPHASRGAAYLDLLRRLRLADNAVPVARITLERRISNTAFYLPALLLTMSRCPDGCLPEILGADLCLRSVGLLPALRLAAKAAPIAAEWDTINPGKARKDGEVTDVERSRAAVRALVDFGGSESERRVSLGFRWALATLRRWSEALHAELNAVRNPSYEMAELLRLRAREAAVYHHGLALGDRSLSEWFKDAQDDPLPLMAQLAASRLVKPGRSDRSSLVGGLVGEKGPMFRVFAPEDLTVIRRWIDSLPGEAVALARPPARTGDQGGALLPSLSTGAEARAEGRSPTGIRDAYHLLQTRTDSPALRRWAEEYVHGWLARSRHGMNDTDPPLPARWGAEGLRPWLIEQHDQHSREFEESGDVPVVSREALVDSTVQLAPLTLIDGSWLQGFTDYEQASSEIGFSLFETYWDELGNGEECLNHPLIYREVMAEMGVVVPPTGSWEFASWEGFRDTSFELPVYWLSIGRFPLTFRPEVLGLNLAMELSGVGGSYRRARIALKHHGFSTRFVDIHNTIDNVASGHSAWAADAVDTYMATLPASEMDEAWERVRAGYRSLNPPGGYWARRAGRRSPYARR